MPEAVRAGARHAQLVDPIDASGREAVWQATLHCIALAGDRLDCEFPPVDVRFDLSGRAAGQYQHRRGKRLIRYNPWLFGKYYDENLRDTVPHEVAHYLVDLCFGPRNVAPHGAEWRAFMHVLDARPRVTCDFDLTGIPQRSQRRYLYRCACRTHEISAVRHGRIRRGVADYVCRYCRGRLNYDHGQDAGTRRTMP